MKKYQFRGTNHETLVKNNQCLASSAYKLLVHIDAYRLEKAEEMLNLGWSEIITNPQNLICVEWPEKLKVLYLYCDKI
jgi:tRNA A37 threonylcarbamoyladenosine biosynthesis protein TsaE